MVEAVSRTAVVTFVMVFVILYWMYWENKRLHARRLILHGGTGAVEAD